MVSNLPEVLNLQFSKQVEYEKYPPIREDFKNKIKTILSMTMIIFLNYSYIPNRRVVLNNRVGRTIFLKD